MELHKDRTVFSVNLRGPYLVMVTFVVRAGQAKL